MSPPHTNDPSQTLELSYVVVSYRSRALLPRHLELIRPLLEAGRAELLVVDNEVEARADAHAAWKELLGLPRGDLRVLQPVRNLGFGAAVNLASSVARGRVMLVANPDALLEPNSLAPLVSVVRENPEVGMASPELVDEVGRPRLAARPWPTLMATVAPGLIGRSVEAPRLIPAGGAASYSALEAGWLSGSCFAVELETFRELGGFDESYFLYYEDVDLCDRLVGAGYTLVLVEAARARHTGGVSTRTRPFRAIATFYWSARRYFFRNDPRFQALWLRRMAEVLLGVRFLWHSLRFALVWLRDGKRPAPC